MHWGGVRLLLRGVADIWFLADSRVTPSYPENSQYSFVALPDRTPSLAR